MAEAKAIKLSANYATELLERMGIDKRGVIRFSLHFDADDIVRADIERVVFHDEMRFLIDALPELSQ